MVTNPTAGLKRCPTCGETKSLDAFNKSKKEKDGLSRECRPCRYIGSTLWRLEQPGYEQDPEIRVRYLRWREELEQWKTAQSSPAT